MNALEKVRGKSPAEDEQQEPAEQAVAPLPAEDAQERREPGPEPVPGPFAHPPIEPESSAPEPPPDLPVIPAPESPLPDPVPSSPDPDLIRAADRQASAMREDTMVLLNYALGSGLKVPEKVASLLQQNSLDGMIQAYLELSQLIKPAIPESVLYLARRRAVHSRMMGSKVPAVKGFMLAGIISFILLIVASSSPLVNEANLANGLLNNSGIVLLLNLLFISSISSLGAIFSILPKITSQIRYGTYLPESNMYYWSMLLLGIFGGMIMGELLSISYNIPDTPMKFDTVVFSLMGGFASESVFLILKMLMNKIQQLLTGSTPTPSD